jgi:hypothetical protein
MMLAVAARRGLILRQFDVSTAFLNGECEEVYIRPPVGTAYLAGVKDRVIRLKRPLYGLRQAPQAPRSARMEQTLQDGAQQA